MAGMALRQAMRLHRSRYVLSVPLRPVRLRRGTPYPSRRMRPKRRTSGGGASKGMVGDERLELPSTQSKSLKTHIHCSAPHFFMYRDYVPVVNRKVASQLK